MNLILIMDESTSSLDIDTEKDYQVLKTIGDYFQKVSEKHFSLADIIRYLSDHPDVPNLNRSEHRKYWDRGVKRRFEG